ncbi:MAG: A/G-specific adenine glycosylase [Pedobacter sp.]|nr:MAG: A/G-specific adenine glycosylase [Pedobacter sp.]
MSFQTQIITWYLQNKRTLPWRDTRDPYIIWLSEIILQQTRVEQGLPYFNKFLANYPTVQAFANASEEQVLKLWQGLGYYSRGRNMLYTARQIMSQHNGVFPSSYQQLLLLKGVGDYTAAAISSFSADECRAVVDGNVFRVLSRYFGIATPINSTSGKKEFTNLAQSLIEDQEPSTYNQAIMEFGALQCKPKAPNCAICPVEIGCYARNNNQVNLLPVKENKLKKRTRHFNYFICTEQDNILVHKRGESDIWQEMYDFPLIETPESYLDTPETFSSELNARFGNNCSIRPLGLKKHLLTHQTIYVEFFALDNYIINFNNNADVKWVSLGDFNNLPQPKVIANFMHSYTTNH